MKPMAVVISSYNNRHWYRQNLGSVCAQEYDNVRALYVDDGSSDQTGVLVEQFLADHAVGHRIRLIRNPVRVGALENLYRMIHTCDDQEIVILLDGDDCLAHGRVLQTLNVVYSDPHCWIDVWPVCVVARAYLPAPNTFDTAHVRRNPTASGMVMCGCRTSSWLSPKIAKTLIVGQRGYIIASPASN
jgi:glycosyltransferase involved in cell wall biosynthesis